MFKAVLSGPLIGCLLAAFFIYLRGKVQRAIDDDDFESAGPGDQKLRNGSVCRYSVHDPLGSAIVRTRRSRR